MMKILKWVVMLVTIQVTNSAQIKIVAPYKKGAEPCILLCAGTTGIGTTKWVEDHNWGVKTTVDMSGCGFVSLPIVNTVVTGDSYHRWATGTSAVYYLTNKEFSVKPARSNRYDTLSIANKYKWRFIICRGNWCFPLN